MEHSSSIFPPAVQIAAQLMVAVDIDNIAIDNIGQMLCCLDYKSNSSSQFNCHCSFPIFSSGNFLLSIIIIWLRGGKTNRKKYIKIEKSQKLHVLKENIDLTTFFQDK